MVLSYFKHYFLFVWTKITTFFKRRVEKCCNFCPNNFKFCAAKKNFRTCFEKTIAFDFDEKFTQSVAQVTV